MPRTRPPCRYRDRRQQFHRKGHNRRHGQTRRRRRRCRRSYFHADPRSKETYRSTHFEVHVVTRVPTVITFQVQRIRHTSTGPTPQRIRRPINNHQATRYNRRPLRYNGRRGTHVIKINRVTKGHHRHTMRRNRRGIVLINRMHKVVQPRMVHNQMSVRKRRQRRTSVQLLRARPLIRRPTRFTSLQACVNTRYNR